MKQHGQLMLCKHYEFAEFYSKCKFMNITHATN